MTSISISDASPIGTGVVGCPPCNPGDLLVAAVMGDWSVPGCPSRGGQIPPLGWHPEKAQHGHLAFYSKIAEVGDEDKTFAWKPKTKSIFRAEIFVIPGATVQDWNPNQTTYVRFCCSPADKKAALCRTGCLPGQDDLGKMPSYSGTAPADGLAIGVFASHPQGFPIDVPIWDIREQIQIAPTPENPAWTVATREYNAGEPVGVSALPASANYQHGMAGILFVS